MLFMALNLFGQKVIEGVGPLSNKAAKGYTMQGTTFDENGNVNVLYKIKGDKNKDELFFLILIFYFLYVLPIF